MRWRTLVVALCLAALSCTPAPGPLVVSGPDVEAIVATEAQLNVTVSARDVGAAMALYHANATMIAPNGQRLNRPAIQRYYEAMADDANARFEGGRAMLVEVAGAEGLAYSSGEYTEWRAAAEPGRVQITNGQTLRVWKREEGAWRIAMESRTVRSSRLD
jgi:ketosteroid isomerase-like protein